MRKKKKETKQNKKLLAPYHYIYFWFKKANGGREKIQISKNYQAVESFAK